MSHDHMASRTTVVDPASAVDVSFETPARMSTFKVYGLLIQNRGAAEAFVDFQPYGGGTPYMTLFCPPNDHREYLTDFLADKGMTVVSNPATVVGEVEVTILSSQSGA